MISIELRNVLEELREAAIARTVSGRILYWNRAASEMYGYSAQEALDMSMDVLIPEEKKQELHERTQQVLSEQRSVSFSTRRRSRDGADSQVALKLVPLVMYGRVEGILELSREKKRFVRSTGYRHLVQTIAHELRSPLLSLKNIAYLLDEQRMERHARVMKRQILHCENVLENLLISAGVQGERAKAISLLEIIGEIREMEVIPANMELNTAAVEDVILSADPVEMRQVMLNLIMNSVDAVGKSPGTISISALAGETVRIEVSDNGPGIAPKMLRRIFHPLFSTKRSGMGLGLSIVKQLVEENGGQISVDSAPGKGSKFVIVLPGYPRTKLL